MQKAAVKPETVLEAIKVQVCLVPLPEIPHY